MENMDGWNLVLLAVAAYVAVVTLARMMIRRRDQLMGRFRREVEKEKRRRAAETLAKAEPPKQDRAA